MESRGLCFWTAGQSLDPSDLESPFVWKLDPGSDMVSVWNYTNWYPGEPNNAHGKTEACMSLFTAQAYKWNDRSCQSEQCSVCEIDIDRSAEPMKQVRMATLKGKIPTP